MAVDDVYSLDIHSTYQQNPNIYCFTYKVVVENDAALVVSDLLTYAENTIQNDMLGFHYPPTVFPCVTTRQIWPDNSLPAISATSGTNGTGTSTTGLPGQCSSVWRIFTDKQNPTPRNRGRDFWYGQDCADLETLGDKYDIGYLTLVAAFYNGLNQGFTPASTNSYQWVMFSRTQALENIDPPYSYSLPVKYSA